MNTHDFTVEIKGRTLEYIDADHTYLVDGVIVPSITTVLRRELGEKYDKVPRTVLQKAANLGTLLHEQIEKYCKTGDTYGAMPEVQNFIFLRNHYGFEPVKNEVPLILFADDTPVAAGRCDLVLKMNGVLIGADIKRTSALDKQYLAGQLNLYRRAYFQSYDEMWQELRGVWLHGSEKRKFVQLPINEIWVDEVVRRLKDGLDKRRSAEDQGTEHVSQDAPQNGDGVCGSGT